MQRDQASSANAGLSVKDMDCKPTAPVALQSAAVVYREQLDRFLIGIRYIAYITLSCTGGKGAVRSDTDHVVLYRTTCTDRHTAGANPAFSDAVAGTGTVSEN